MGSLSAQVEEKKGGDVQGDALRKSFSFPEWMGASVPAKLHQVVAQR